METKKYILIKKYPGSPALGTEYTKAISYGHYNYNGGDWDTRITVEEIGNNSQFFEEVKEKEYEILSFRNKYDDSFSVLITSKDIDFYSKLTGIWKIYSVKRIIDSEVFIIGDKFGTGNCLKWEIRTISLIKQDLRVIGICITKVPEEGYVQSFKLDKLIKVESKQKLFTTEDLVDIYEGDEYWFVRKDYSYRIVTATRIGHISARETHGEYLGDFSTKEKAKEYINRMKPYLSNQDVINIVENMSTKRQIIDYFREKVTE